MKLRFSHWVTWKNRNKLQGADSPGVYLLARHGKPPLTRANPLDRNIVYIGETCGSNLKLRWNKFNQAAFKGGRVHSGGLSYKKAYGADDRRLYVAIYVPSKVSNGVRPYFIRYIERKILWEFVRKHGSDILLNRK